MSKKILSIVLMAVLLTGTLFSFSGCGNTKKINDSINNNSNSETLNDSSNINNATTENSVISGVKKRYEDEKNSETYDKDGAFLMDVRTAITYAGSGTCVEGKIERGTVKQGDEVQIVGLNREEKTAKVIEIRRIDDYEEYKVYNRLENESIEVGEAGEYVDVFLSGINRSDIERGQVLASPNSIESKKKFDAEIYVPTVEEGGIRYSITDGYKTQFYFTTTDITGVINFADNYEMINPGDNNVKITVELILDVAMQIGDKFEMHSGGRTIGYGYVTKVYD